MVHTLENKERRKEVGQVRVMRSYDYCHFEVALDYPEDASLDAVNERRKEAALLVDEAVRQYKIAKKAEADREWHQRDAETSLKRIEAIKEKPQSEWNVEEAALMRAYADKSFWDSIEHDSYYYQECDPEREWHFSMLRKFQDTRISA
jgi:hypothetical protein